MKLCNIFFNFKILRLVLRLKLSVYVCEIICTSKYQEHFFECVYKYSRHFYFIFLPKIGTENHKGETLFSH